MFATGGKDRESELAQGVDGSDEARDKIWLGQHLSRVGGAALFATVVLGWLWAHTDVLFADGLRYIAQARAFERGSSDLSLRKAVDHPVYPLAIAGVHWIFGGEGPEGWQRGAQLASMMAGVLLVIPIYLVSRELFGNTVSLPACLLVYAVPLTGHVFADALSESTFLLFWMWGLWGGLRFLKGGSLGWAAVVVGFSGLAYLTRPEGLLLPASVLAAIGMSPIWVARGLGKRGLAVVGVLVAGSAAVVGPYVIMRGGLGTKPSIARLLGTAPKSAAHAVERQRPLEPGQTAGRTYALACKAVIKATGEAVTWPLLAFAFVGLVGLRPVAGEVRQWRLLGVIGVVSMLALVRLHATGGYCSARHAMIPAMILIPAAAAGIGRQIGRVEGWMKVGAGRRFSWEMMGWGIVTAGVVGVNASGFFAPVNAGLDGYRQAGRWLAEHTSGESHVVDVTGWSQFYGQRDGYTFGDLVAAPADPMARWVVAREAHLKGPWGYCERLRALVEGLEPVEVFVGSVKKQPTKVYVYDRQPRIAGVEKVRR